MGVLTIHAIISKSDQQPSAATRPQMQADFQPLLNTLPTMKHMPAQQFRDQRLVLTSIFTRPQVLSPPITVL